MILVSNNELRDAAPNLTRKLQIRLMELTMLPASQPISIPREPPIKFLGQRSHERNQKNPRDESALRQRVDDLLERGRALPRMPGVILDELH